MKEEEIKALMLLSGMKVLSFHKLENRYWPDAKQYEEIRKENPWWLVQIPEGLLIIGWRRRVISIDWENTGLRQIITEDEVTKEETLVHAWGYAPALRYLVALRFALATKFGPEPKTEAAPSENFSSIPGVGTIYHGSLVPTFTPS